MQQTLFLLSLRSCSSGEVKIDCSIFIVLIFHSQISVRDTEHSWEVKMCFPLKQLGVDMKMI